jgi:hypothetical protein
LSDDEVGEDGAAQASVRLVIGLVWLFPFVLLAHLACPTVETGEWLMRAARREFTEVSGSMGKLDGRPGPSEVSPDLKRRVVLPLVVAEVVWMLRAKPTLELAELWAAIQSAFTTFLGVPPSPSQLVAIENAVIEYRFDERRRARRVSTRPDTELTSRLGGGSQRSAREDTSPWQDNAIRALEGD